MDRSSCLVTAFLEHLVDQLLPTKSAAQDTPAQSKQQLVAKQVHSLVLLYNFYHRKQHPEVPFLAFEEFCRLLVALRPTLSAYMKFTQNCSHEADEEELAIVDAANQLSLTEEKIMEACDICRHLDASKDVPSTEGWPITKVAVVLIDCRLEDCFLTFGSTTKGVWSLIEQEADEVDCAEEELTRIAYSVVKKATCIYVDEDIMSLENYSVYSHSKEKGASRFYIMKYSRFIRMSNRIPLKRLIESLQGPLVTESSSGSWMLLTSVIDYFDLLPYYEGRWAKGNRSCRHRHMEEHGGTTISSNDDYEAPLRAADPTVIQRERVRGWVVETKFY